jgi:hypothetical protein
MVKKYVVLRLSSSFQCYEINIFLFIEESIVKLGLQRLQSHYHIDLTTYTTKSSITNSFTNEF